MIKDARQAEAEKQQKRDQKKLQSFVKQYEKLLAKFPEVTVYPDIHENIVASISQSKSRVIMPVQPGRSFTKL